MNGKRAASLPVLAAALLFAFPAHADQIVPNPNNGTIVVSDRNAYNSESPFVNNGVIQIEQTGALDNISSVLFNSGTVNNTGTLDNVFSTLSNSGTLDTSGYMLNAVSTVNNSGSINNSGTLFNAQATMNNYGTLQNTGSLLTLLGIGLLALRFGARRYRRGPLRVS